MYIAWPLVMLALRQKQMPVTGTDRQVFLDIATVKKTKTGPPITKPNWHLIVDERMTLKFLDNQKWNGRTNL
jgi:hypothetical protein